jgi:DNA polymerase-3 subunit alpha (Gram-positive type)
MDGVGEIEKYIKVAKSMGHKSHRHHRSRRRSGYPDAQKEAKAQGIKMIYGAELYMVDDNLKYVDNPSDITLHDATYVCFDFETTASLRNMTASSSSAPPALKRE